MGNNDKVQEVRGAGMTAKNNGAGAKPNLLEEPSPMLKAFKTKVEKKGKAIKSLQELQKGKSYKLSNFKLDSLKAIIVPVNGIRLEDFQTALNAVLATARFNPSAESFNTLLRNVLGTYISFIPDVKEGVIIEEES